MVCLFNWISAAAFIFFASPARADSCLGCNSPNKNAFIDQLKVKCELEQQQLKCDEFKKHAKPEEQAKFVDCSNRESLCESLFPEDQEEVFSCLSGAGGVLYKAGEAIVMIVPSVLKLLLSDPNSIKMDFNFFSNCYDRLDQKLLYMGPLRPPEMSDEVIQKASCADIQKMMREKVKVTLARLEDKRQAAIIKKGSEDVSFSDLAPTEQETHALNFSRNHNGVLGFSQCYTKLHAIEAACGEMTQAALLIGGPAIVSGVAKGAARVVAKVTPMVSPAARRAAEMARAIENNSAAALGTPYPVNRVFNGSPLGEGPTGTFSTRPLICKSQVDCVTYVEQTVAGSLATTSAETVPILNKIRFAKGEIGYPTINHFTDANWIPNNIANGVFDDITAAVAGNTTKVVEATIDKGAWLRKKAIPDIRNDNMSFLDKKKVIEDLHETSKSIKPVDVSLPVVPMDALAGNAEVLSRIPSGSVFSIVRNSTNWQTNGKSYPVGTIVNHQGFIIRKNGELFVRHASSVELKVVDAPLVEYFKSLHKHYPDLAGINILRATGNRPP